MLVILLQVLSFLLTNAHAQQRLSLNKIKRVNITLPHGGCLEGIQWRVNDMNDVDAFLGIPFAKPPLGDLRFAPPVPADPWKGKRDATQMPKACMQYISGAFDKANPATQIWINNTVMDEDCLYLNIWVPTESLGTGALFPVLVWIFGGGFFSGSASLDVYDGRFLSAMESVIVVSMQYRLGPFGFLYIESEVDGNMGLKDQQLALKWVQDNIKAFNGDPNQVTIFGESAGAVSVGLHYLAPTSRPLFKRMIMESSSPLNRWALSTPADAHETGISFIKASNCSDKNGDLAKEVACLRMLPADSLFERLFDLMVASTKRREVRLAEMYSKPQWPVSFLDDGSQYFDVYMRPVLDGDFLPDCPSTILKSIQSGSGPEVLIGSVDKEGIFWVFYGLGLKGIKFLQDDGNITLPTLEQLKKLNIDYLELVQTRFMSIGHLYEPFPAIATVQYGLNSPVVPEVNYYDTERAKNDITSSLHFLHQMDDFSGEMDFICGTLLFARLLSNIPNAKVQYFNFMHKTVNSQFPAWTGAMHGYEIEYVFGMPFSEPFTRKYYSFSAEEQELSRRMMRYWANFARTGNASENPNSYSNQTIWPLFNSSGGAYVEIGIDKDIVKSHLRNKGCTFWNDVFPGLVRTHLRRSGALSHSKYTSIENCPHMETNLYNIQRLRDFVPGEYYNRSERLILPWISWLGLLWMLI